MSSDLEPLAAPARALRQDLDDLTAPHRTTLWRYCRKLTGSSWDAEDLVQEVVLKAFARLSYTWQPIEARAYLFRMASYAWIDRPGRDRPTVPLEETPVWPDDTPAIDPLDTRDALKQVVDHLPPRQRVVFLLTECFGFAHAEVATMLGLSAGAWLVDVSVRDGLVQSQRLYCFCPDLLEEIGEAIGIPARTRGYAYVGHPSGARRMAHGRRQPPPRPRS